MIRNLRTNLASWTFPWAMSLVVLSPTLSQPSLSPVQPFLFPTVPAVSTSQGAFSGEASMVVTEDLTLPTEETKDRLERILVEQDLGPLSVRTAIRYAIRRAVDAGVPLNTIVLLLLFPLVAMTTAAARHLLGLRGFGIFTPAAVAVAFLVTGLSLGITLFLATLFLATFGRFVTRQLRLQYLPRLALLIWFMCTGILLAFLAFPFLGPVAAVLGLSRLASVGIFPILLLILLTETFISAQITQGGKEATQMTIETILLASVSYLVMDLRFTQSWVLIHPELTMASLAIINILLGRFSGLRFFEYVRFRELLRK